MALTLTLNLKYGNSWQIDGFMPSPNSLQKKILVALQYERKTFDKATSVSQNIICFMLARIWYLSTLYD